MGGWNIFYGLLNFAILAAILYFFGRKLVVNMFKTRRDRIAGDLERARQAEENAAALQDDLNASGAEADKLNEQIISDAQKTAVAMKQRAEAEIAQEKKRVLNETKDEISEIAMAIAGKVVGRELTASDHAQMVDSFIDKLGDEV